MIDRQTVSVLVCIGEALNHNSARVKSYLGRIKDHDEINRLHWREWDAVTEIMLTPRLVSLVKGLVIAEERLGWAGGSASAVIWTFKALERRDPQLAETVADWVLARTTNPYAPFGRSNLGVRSISEYLERIQSRQETKRRKAERIAKEKEAARANRMLRSLQSQVRVELQKLQSLKRRKEIEGLLFLRTEDVLRKIAKDQEHRIEYYPVALVRHALAEVKDIDAEIAVALYARVKHYRSGPWKKVADLLSKRVSA